MTPEDAKRVLDHQVTPPPGIPGAWRFKIWRYHLRSRLARWLSR